MSGKEWTQTHMQLSEKLSFLKYFENPSLEHGFHSKVSLLTIFKKLVGSCIHSAPSQPLLIYGPSQLEKVFRVYQFLAEVYGCTSISNLCESEVLPDHLEEDLRHTYAQWDNQCAMTVQCLMLRKSSTDERKLMDVCTRLRQNAVFSSTHFKTFIFLEFDALERASQTLLLSHIRQSKHFCIFVIDELSKVLPAIKNICMCIRIAKPPLHELQNFLEHVSKMEDYTSHKNWPSNSSEYLTSVCLAGKCRVFESLTLLSVAASLGFGSVDKVIQLGKNPLVWKICKLLMLPITLNALDKRLTAIRFVLYEMLAHINPPTPESILVDITEVLLRIHKGNLTYALQLTHHMAETSLAMVKGYFPIIHLEHLCLQIILLEKQSKSNCTSPIKEGDEWTEQIQALCNKSHNSS